jgi:hypothetical protein
LPSLAGREIWRRIERSGAPPSADFSPLNSTLAMVGFNRPCANDIDDVDINLHENSLGKSRDPFQVSK